MEQKKSFRCPFEIQGINEGAIIEVQLSEKQEERFAATRDALEDFHLHSKKIAIRVVLPQSVQGCTTFEQLRDVLMPYQAEMIAADLDDVLYPYLPHQKQARELHGKYGLGLSLFDEGPALRLNEAFGADVPLSIGALAVWIRDQCSKCGSVSIRDAQGDLLVHFDLSSLCVYGKSGEPAKSMMSVVLSPLYPEGTARFSKRVEIVLTRHFDAVVLPQRVRERIRALANESYASHGLPVGLRDAQPAGLWIPGEKFRIERL